MYKIGLFLTGNAYIQVSAGAGCIVLLVFVLSHIACPHILSQSKCTYLLPEILLRFLWSRAITLLIIHNKFSAPCG